MPNWRVVLADRHLLAVGQLRVVGSVLHKRKPRDLDLVLVVPDEVFVEFFGWPDRWEEEGESGDWTAVRHRWSAACIRLSREMARRMRTDLPVDLHVLPASLPWAGM